MESMTIAKTVAKLRAKINDGGSFKLKIDPSQELVALGMCNVAVSFLRGYPVTGSFSRTAVNGDSGARSPFASMTCALVVGGALVLLTNYLKYLPKVVLATIVLISIVKLVDVDEAVYLFRVCKRDFVVFMIIFLSTIFLGVEDALLIGILSNWALYLSHANKTQVTVLGRRKGNSSGDCVDVLATGVSDSENHVIVLKLFTGKHPTQATLDHWKFSHVLLVFCRYLLLERLQPQADDGGRNHLRAGHRGGRH
jgi:MFS superfamily sulfate permease-like transporter